jgi:hypothetical protein
VVNKSDIVFTSEEHKSSQQRSEVQLTHKKENWIQNLAFEAENAVNFASRSIKNSQRSCWLCFTERIEI